MHQEVVDFISFVKSKHLDKFINSKVLEVGSLNINGTIRSFFDNCSYIGLDIGSGPGVDVVCPIHQYDPTRSEIWNGSASVTFQMFSAAEGFQVIPHFDVVISTEMLEHDVHWRESLQRMYDLVKPNSLMVLTCAGPARHEHGTKRTTPQDSPFTTDYYRNISVEDFLSVLGEDLFSESYLKLHRGDTDLCFYGIKKAA